MTKEEIRKKLEEENQENYQERFNLHGKLIACIKEEIKKEKDPLLQARLKLELYEELQTHQKMMDRLKHTDEYITIPKKVALKVKEIANAIDLFVLKNDVVEKTKRIGINTALGGALAVAVSLGLAAVTGGVSLATIVSVFPTIGYIGLTNLLRSFVDKTSMQKLIEAYDHKEENQEKYKAFFNQYIMNNTEFHKCLNVYKEAKTREEKITLLKQIIAHFEIILDHAPTDDIKQAFQVEQTDYMKQLKNLYMDQKEDYIVDKVEMSPQEFAKLERDILSLNMQILEKEYFLKDAFLDATKKTGSGIAIMMVARALIGLVNPGMGITSIQDLLTPSMILLISNLLSIPGFKDKIQVKPTRYADKKIVIDKEKLKEKLQLEQRTVLAAA